MKLQTSLSAALAVVMLFCIGAKAEGPGGKPSFTWPVPEGWKAETIPFPLDFAPDIHHTGVEELRFSPGFANPDAPDNWAYAFAWILEDDAIFTEATLAEEMTAYFKGLSMAVGSKKFEFDPKHFAAHFQARPAASGAKAREYTGTVGTYDCFRTGKPITLHQLVRVIPCQGGIRAVLVATSRLEDDDKIWPGLRHLLDDFKCGGSPQAASDPKEPVEQVYASPGGSPLKAYIFPPEKSGEGRRPAIVLIHGGGWVMGEPQWAFARARRFAERGMVAIAAQYRLSDQKNITPIEAMEDVRAVIRWMRSNADSLGIDPKRVAAYGWSAGAHLAASAAIFNKNDKGKDVSASPDALVLVSPAVSLEEDSHVQRLLGTRARASDISPDEHVRKGLPPTLILQGDVDTVTPLSGAKRFCDRMRTAGNACELHVYKGFGHLFTPAGTPDDDWPQPDPATSADALARAGRFLESLGF